MKLFFSGHSVRFRGIDPETDRNLQLKEEHTFRVCAIAGTLADAENFTPQEKKLLHYAAMLHDISRFEQFFRFKTFNDLISFDHGRRSAEIASEMDWSDSGFSPAEIKCITDAICFHNQRFIPEGLPPETVKILQAVRDADKTDIMQILIDHLRNPENPAIVYKLEKATALSSKVRECLLAGRSPDNRDLKSDLDFCAAKFAWGFDLAYSWTCREFLNRRYMQSIHDLLPAKTPETTLILEKVLLFMQHAVPEKGR